MSDSRARLEGYLSRRLARSGVSLSSEAAGPTILRELAASILPSGDETSWKRRPSISDDGTPVVLSLKTGRRQDDGVRVLVEPGSLQMPVAAQIAYSLMKLDDLLGLLAWRGVAEEINAITGRVFPADASATSGWRGGVWLGADVDLASQEPELRLYLNLRHEEADERWRRLLGIVSAFSSPTIDPFLGEWRALAAPHAIPVGLGVVVSGGRLGGIRAYLGIENPGVDSLAAFVPEEGQSALRLAHDTFVSRFGAMRRQAVTIGCDFAPGATAAARTKVDICCHLVGAELAVGMSPWIEELLAAWSLDAGPLQQFSRDVQESWRGSAVQFLSLGFASGLEHATVYVKPCD